MSFAIGEASPFPFLTVYCRLPPADCLLPTTLSRTASQARPW
jgi:hypothetical protein